MNDYARKAFREIYKSYMVEGAKWDLKYDIPFCPCTAKDIPKKLIYYNEITKSKRRYLGFVHFYMDDYKFESIWRDPHKALKKLKRCDGIITPDFSTYQDMPAALKIYNTYRMRAIGYWLGKQGLQVINNVRWGYSNSYKYCFDGIEQNSIVCISTVGCLGDKHDEDRFTEGLEAMVETLNPSNILFYGMQGRNFMDKYIEAGIPVTFYEPPDTHTLITKTVTEIDLED
ncbi:MAG: DUF4417 domain-containing protein [Selenomonadaceae bacterium]|nr:DUF4417 domain-containing protein [Selenomonadaceae bacterium]